MVECVKRLCDSGNTVGFSENNLDVNASAGWDGEMETDGGQDVGKIVA